MLTHPERAQIIHAEAERFADVLATVIAAETDPAPRVPTCPDWTSLQLLAHLTEVHDFWAAVIGRGLDEAGVEAYQADRAALPTELDALLVARASATQALLAALESRAPGEPAWSWFAADQTVDFTWRMQTHEAIMHRVDAELAAGLAPGPIAPHIAADGVTHVVDVMWQWAPEAAARTTTGCLELHATDTGETWLLDTQRWSGTAWGQAFENQPTCVRNSRGSSPDARVAGSAEALDLLVWTRADAGVARDGDPRVLGEFQAVLDAGIM